jgi:Right handed beta helix region
VYNTAGFYVANINFVGAGAGSNTQSGILLYTALSGNVKLDTVFIDQVDVSGFSTGITIGAWNNLTGFKNVSITSTSVHDNARDGILVYGYTSSTMVGYPNQNIYIGHTVAYNNTGGAGATQVTGNGIAVGNSDGVVIERSLAYNNGTADTHNGGPVGIWAWNSNNVIIQHNESHHNHTAATTDGGGFDLDGGTTNSTMQYNYSHDNDGPGYLLCQYSGARAWHNNNVRYNISQNDGRKNGAAGVHLYNGGSGVQNAQIFNNTIFMSPAGMRPRGIYLQTTSTNVSIRNNILITTGGVPVLQAVAGQSGLVLQGNDYWPSGSGLSIVWGSSTYNSLASFRTATAQEMYSSTPVGSSIDPQLNAPGTGASINNSDLLDTLTAYSPKAGSPMIDTALTMQTLFGVSPGPYDYMGNTIYRGLAFDVGAVEY